MKSAKTPVSTKVVKESLKSIILSGESDLKRYVSHRFLYIFGFLTGWHPKIFSLELLPLIYFLGWAVVLYGLREYIYATFFVVAFAILFIYFLLLHSIISSWDRIKRWFIKRARKQGGIEQMTLEDIRFLLIFTRKVFRVKPSISSGEEVEFNPSELRLNLIRNKRWLFSLNITIIITLLALTASGIYGAIMNVDFLSWLWNWWYIILIAIIPSIFMIICLAISKGKIRMTINNVPADDFEEVLKVLNEFEIFGAKSNKNN
ncbi:MAG: hypothetical protein FK734_06280 [Asgard group archaeon]|nr:hypothetical protein [Asgard group archaeon]